MTHHRWVLGSGRRPKQCGNMRRTRTCRMSLKKGRPQDVGWIRREAVLVVKHEKLVAGQPLALGASCLVGFTAARLPSRGSFVAVTVR